MVHVNVLRVVAASAHGPVEVPFVLNLREVGEMLLGGIGTIMGVFVPIAVGLVLLRLGIRWVMGKTWAGYLLTQFQHSEKLDAQHQKFERWERRRQSRASERAEYNAWRRANGYAGRRR